MKNNEIDNTFTHTIIYGLHMKTNVIPSEIDRANELVKQWSSLTGKQIFVSTKREPIGNTKGHRELTPAEEKYFVEEYLKIQNSAVYR